MVVVEMAKEVFRDSGNVSVVEGVHGEAGVVFTKLHFFRNLQMGPIS
jgi:hypothetical protein